MDSGRRHVLVLLPDLSFHTALCRPASFNRDDLFVLGQKLGSGRTIGEDEDEEEGGDEREEGDDDHEPLPLGDLLRVLWSVGGREIDAIGDEAGGDLGETVALEGPADALTHLYTVVEHGAEKHDSRSDASFGKSEKQTKGD